MYKKGVENAVIPNVPNNDDNDEEIDDDTVIYDADSFTFSIESLQDEMMENKGAGEEN